ncbi:MAG: hypothetical protein U9R74_09525 [Pseudomonadota bacterium]|nr:hypothetical protein [Pseudomonadota bacterium]
MKLFRTQGIDAMAAPMDLQSIYDPVLTVLDYLPDAASLYQTTLAVNGYSGMGWTCVLPAGARDSMVDNRDSTSSN